MADPNDLSRELARAETLLRAALTAVGEEDPERTAGLLELVARVQFDQGRSADAAAACSRASRARRCPTGPKSSTRRRGRTSSSSTASGIRP